MIKGGANLKNLLIKNCLKAIFPVDSNCAQRILVIKNPLKTKKICTPVSPENKLNKLLLRYWFSKNKISIPKWLSKTKPIDIARNESKPFIYLLVWSNRLNFFLKSNIVIFKLDWFLKDLRVNVKKLNSDI